jgi:hypothetical protein
VVPVVVVPVVPVVVPVVVVPVVVPAVVVPVVVVPVVVVPPVVVPPVVVPPVVVVPAVVSTGTPLNLPSSSSLQATIVIPEIKVAATVTVNQFFFINKTFLILHAKPSPLYEPENFGVK